MAVDDVLYRKLLFGGMSHHAAMLMADPVVNPVAGAAVTTPAAMTAPATMAAVYTQTEIQSLRTDVANLRTTVVNLLTALRNAGVIAP